MQWTFDGVLANFSVAYIEVANKLFPGRFPRGYEPSDWEWDGLVTPAEDAQVWAKIRATDNFWLGLDAYPEAVQALASFMVMQKDHEVYIVTARAETAGMSVCKQTEWWLKSCGISPVQNYLGVIAAPSSNAKWQMYLSTGFDFSIDDKAETVEQCDFIHPRLSKHKAYLLDQKWNQHGVVKRRVKSMAQFLAEVTARV